MNDLMQISSHAVADAIAQTVNARDLHAFLEVGRDFSNWVKDRIAQYGFVKGQDFVTAEILSSPNLASAKSRAQVLIEYHLTLDMAKELAMVERNEKGKQARQYFIECERRLRSRPQVDMGGFEVPRTLPEALRLAAVAMEEKENALAQAEQANTLLALAAPKVEALERISTGTENVTITQAAKVLGIKRDALSQWLHTNGWVYRQNGSWVAYDAQIRTGRLVYKEAHYTDDKTDQRAIKPYCHITPKGLAWLAEHGPKAEVAA